MPNIAPALLLVIAAGITGTVLGLALMERLLRRRRLARLAAESGYQLDDRNENELAARLLSHLPIGAADVRAIDRLARPLEEAGGRHIVARVDYSLGSVHHRRNNTRIIACDQDVGGAIRNVQIAPLEARRLEQYRRLLKS